MLDCKKGLPVLLLCALLAACQRQRAAPIPGSPAMVAPTMTAAPIAGSATPGSPATLEVKRTPSATPSAVPLPLTPTPTPATMQSFASEAYGFSLVHPSSWTPVTTLPNQVSFVRAGTGIALRFMAKRVGNEINLVRSGVSAGEFVERDPVAFLGQPITSQTLVYQDRDKAVFYEQAGEIARDDLIFVITLESNRSDYEAIDIPPDIQVEADAIVSSVKLSPPSAQPVP